jgi:hypothetical protein
MASFVAQQVRQRVGRHRFQDDSRRGTRVATRHLEGNARSGKEPEVQLSPHDLVEADDRQLPREPSSRNTVASIKS